MNISTAILLLVVIGGNSYTSRQDVMMMSIPQRPRDAETGSAFMARISSLPLAEREEEIYRAAVSGNIPSFLRRLVRIKAERSDSGGAIRVVEYAVMPDYLAIGSDEDYCRIPANPCTAQRIANHYGATLPTALISDQVYDMAEIKLTPFNYIPVGNANELVEKFVEHNKQIDSQFAEAGGKPGQLTAGIKKDIIISVRMALRHDRVVIYGWHKPGGIPIQPVYSGHVYWYVDYSHGIRLVSNLVKIDGIEYSVSKVLQDPLLFRLLSNEDEPMQQTVYICPSEQTPKK